MRAENLKLKIICFRSRVALWVWTFLIRLVVKITSFRSRVALWHIRFRLFWTGSSLRLKLLITIIAFAVASTSFRWRSKLAATSVINRLVYADLSHWEGIFLLRQKVEHNSCMLPSLSWRGDKIVDAKGLVLDALPKSRSIPHSR